MTHPVSVIVRVKNEASAIVHAISSLREQTVSCEVIVVDSGSTDGTLDVVQDSCDRLIMLPAEEFTYGRSLNIGAVSASGEIHVALSAHCRLPDPNWLLRVTRHYEDERVVATNGAYSHPDTRLALDAPYFETISTATHHPYWGFSNHASSWRATAWGRHSFNEELEASEDKEWAWRQLRDGWTIVFDPRLVVDASHRRRAGSRSLFHRTRKEMRGLIASVDEVPPLTVRDAVRRWWDVPAGGRRPAWVARANPRAVIAALGSYRGSRDAERLMSSSPDLSRSGSVNSARRQSS